MPTVPSLCIVEQHATLSNIERCTTMLLWRILCSVDCASYNMAIIIQQDATEYLLTYLLTYSMVQSPS